MTFTTVNPSVDPPGDLVVVGLQQPPRLAVTVECDAGAPPPRPDR
jgi:hypothetical protein